MFVPLYLSVISLSIYLCVYLYLSVISLSIYLCVYLYLSVISLSLCLCVSLSLCNISIYLSLSLSLCNISVYFCLCLSVCPCWSLFLFIIAKNSSVYFTNKKRVDTLILSLFGYQGRAKASSIAKNVIMIAFLILCYIKAPKVIVVEEN